MCLIRCICGDAGVVAISAGIHTYIPILMFMILQLASNIMRRTVPRNDILPEFPVPTFNTIDPILMNYLLYDEAVFLKLWGSTASIVILILLFKCGKHSGSMSRLRQSSRDRLSEHAGSHTGLVVLNGVGRASPVGTTVLVACVMVEK